MRGNHYIHITPSYKLTIIYGNARETIRSLNQNFNIIYQDAFSPKKNPSLWTIQWFKDLARVSDQNVRMSTYCSSVGARKAMIAAGFKLQEGGAFKRKRSSTRATLLGDTDNDITIKLNQSKIKALVD